MIKKFRAALRQIRILLGSSSKAPRIPRKAPAVIGFDHRWLTRSEAACYIRVSSRTMTNLISQGEVPFHRVGSAGRLLFDRLELDGWLLSSGPHLRAGAI